MLREILIAGGLAVVTVAIHGVGFDALLRAIMWSRALARSGVWRVGPLVIGLTCWLVLIHLIEISIWGLFYFWQGWFPDTEAAFYFSAGAYTTVGGSLALPEPWRMFAPLEALTGALMFALSGGLFFAIVSRWIHNFMEAQARGYGAMNK